MVLTRSQTKRLALEEAQPIHGVVFCYLKDSTFPVKIYIKSLNKNTKKYHYQGGLFYSSRDFEVVSIEAVQSSGKRTRYSYAVTTLNQEVEHGHNITDKPTLFFDKL
jgi:hypothetical protein